VTVFLLFISGVTSLNHFNVEVQSLTGQRMVRVDSDSFFAHFHNTDNLGATRSLCLELHSRLDGVNTFERGTGNRLDQLFVYFTIGISRCHRNLQLITDSLIVQCAFQTTDDVLCAYEVGP